MTPEQKERQYLLQKIDCNCNDCIFMVRDMETFKKWENWNREIQEQGFKSKQDLLKKAIDNSENEQAKKTLQQQYNKMKFQFSRDSLISYGNCSKFNKPVSFIPNNCQLDTQGCFLHRKDATIDK